MRESFGVDGDGMIVERRGSRENYNDVDEFSYNDEIRCNWFARQQNRHAKRGHNVDDYRDVRSHRDTFRLLGYPEFILRHFTNKLLHSFEEKFGEKFFDPPKDTMLMKASYSVVSLSSFLSSRIGERRLFTCSGTVIEVTRQYTLIVTSACLVSHSDDDGNLILAKDLKIKVRFGEENPCYAKLVGCCLHYNLAFIKIYESCEAWPLQLSRRECLPKGHDVFALGRHYLSGSYMVASGRTIVKNNHFDCAELLFSSCKITKCGTGGPLVDSHGELVGINFYDEKDTPYLPTCLVSECWHHILRYKKVIHPSLGWRLSALENPRREEIYTKHRLFDGLLVDKVENESPVKLSGVNDGDIIYEFCGEPAVFLPQCAAALLDKANILMKHEHTGLKFEVKIISGEVMKCLTIYTNQTRRRRDFYRWPLPKVGRQSITIPRERFILDILQ